MSLENLGWSPYWTGVFESSGYPAAGDLGRVVGDWGNMLQVETAGARMSATNTSNDAPAVIGDWVVLSGESDGVARVVGVLSRRTELARAASGKATHAQVLAANVDVVLVVMGLDGDFNVRRVERLLTGVWASGARPVILLSKVDLCESPRARAAEIESAAPGVLVHGISVPAGVGLGELEQLIPAGESAVLIGSSGVGKSTLVNHLLGDLTLRTQAVRSSDQRGRHTTTHRQLFRLPWGGLLIDSPGIRAFKPWSDATALAKTFDDIDRLSRECRFRNCTHQSEPGCAVLAAIEDEALSRARLGNLRKMEREQEHLESKVNDPQRRDRERRQGKYYKQIQAAHRKRRGKR